MNERARSYDPVISVWLQAQLTSFALGAWVDTEKSMFGPALGH